MANLHQQLLLDMAGVLADSNGPSQQATIGSTTLAVIRDFPALVPADGDGLLVERQVLYLLRAVLGFAPVTGQELLVDGSRWLVESCPPGDVVELHLIRYRT